MERPEHATLIRMIVTPSFNAAATMTFLDPFRAANYLEGAGLFHWTVASEAGGPVRASNGCEITTVPLATEPAPRAGDLVVVSSSWEPHATPRLRAALRTAAKNQAILGALDTGAFVLAEAGLLSGYEATVHYEHMDAFAESFPDTSLSESLWVMDRRRATCCGGAATLDLALHLIEQLRGAALANAAARYVFAPPLRRQDVRQSAEDAEPLGASVPPGLRTAIRVMEAHLETPLPISEVAARADLSHRQLNRLFARYVRKTPALYYRDIRLDRARGLVTQTNLSMAEIAYASGFASQVHFSRAYRDRFRLAPTKDRVQGRIPFEFRAWPMHRAPKDPGAAN